MSENQVNNELQSLQKQIEDQIKPIKAEYQKKAGAALYQLAEAIFNKHPQIKALFWEQYTPYFNDGDTCVFSIHGENNCIFELDGEEYECECGYFDDVDDGIIEGQLEALYNAAKSDLSVFDSFINSNEELMQEIFGDHCKVTIRRDSKTAEVDEYEDHD